MNRVVTLLCTMVLGAGIAACAPVNPDRSMDFTLKEAHRELARLVASGSLKKWRSMAIYVGMVGDAYRQPYTNELQAFAVYLDEEMQKHTLTMEEAELRWQQEIDSINTRIVAEKSPGKTKTRLWSVEGSVTAGERGGQS